VGPAFIQIYIKLQVSYADSIIISHAVTVSRMPYTRAGAHKPHLERLATTTTTTTTTGKV
jgi:hypothetical protein